MAQRASNNTAHNYQTPRRVWNKRIRNFGWRTEQQSTRQPKLNDGWFKGCVSEGRSRISIRMNPLVIVLTLLLVTSSAHATRQAPDPLVWNGETVYPERGATIWNAFPEKQKPKFDMDTTANWKGYRARWQIKEDTLFLTALVGKIDGRKVGLPELFPGKTSPVAATWFSGTLIIPRGKEIGLAKKGEARYIYTKETHLTIAKGKVVRKEEKTFDPEKTPVWRN